MLTRYAVVVAICDARAAPAHDRLRRSTLCAVLLSPALSSGHGHATRRSRALAALMPAAEEEHRKGLAG